jgi:hypothetical protein
MHRPHRRTGDQPSLHVSRRAALELLVGAWRTESDLEAPELDLVVRGVDEELADESP